MGGAPPVHRPAVRRVGPRAVRLRTGRPEAPRPIPLLAQALKWLAVVMVPLVREPDRMLMYCQKVQLLPVMQGWFTCWCL